MRQPAVIILLGATMLALVSFAALPAVAGEGHLATPEQLAKALTGRVINKALVRDYLDNGGDPNVCIPQTQDNGRQTTCINLTLVLILPTTKSLALLALQKGGLKSSEDVQRGFWYAVNTKLPFVVQALIKKGANVNGQDSYGEFPITTAAENNDFKTVKFLTRAGANLNQVDFFRYTALARALQSHNEKMALYLVHHGASLKVKTNTNDTMLTFAIGSGSIPFVTALVSLNFDTNIVDRYDFTPLVWAIYTRQIAPKDRARIIKLLLKHGADPCHRIPRNAFSEFRGESALDIARHFRQPMSIKILQPATENCKKPTDRKKP